ncbi:MAG: sugar phosphate isomerase/epimerase [Oscillospiraceae bacterium]|nr:sugar phosphate isomerase/epimerase [Oscillospiraceae bacterium]
MEAKISCLPVSLYKEFFVGDRTIPQWSQQAAQLGLDSVDINALFIREKSMEQIRAIRSELTVPVLMVSAYSDFTLPDAAARAEALQTALEDMDRAAAIGAKYIRLTAGQAWPGEDDEVMCQRVYDCFKVCCEKAEKLGLTILLENHSKPGAWQYIDFDFHLERFLLLWDKVKELPISVNFDTANAYALTDWKKILNAVAGRIATVHINDLASVEPLQFCLAGDGIVPMEQILDAVYATGFAGDICLEEAGFLGWEGNVKAIAYTLELCKKYGFEK